MASKSKQEGEFHVDLVPIGVQQWKDSVIEGSIKNGTVSKRKLLTVNIFSRSLEIECKISPKAVVYKWEDKLESNLHGYTKCFSYSKAQKNVIEQFIKLCISNEVGLILPQSFKNANGIKKYTFIRFEGDDDKIEDIVPPKETLITEETSITKETKETYIRPSKLEKKEKSIDFENEKQHQFNVPLQKYNEIPKQVIPVETSFKKPIRNYDTLDMWLLNLYCDITFTFFFIGITLKVLDSFHKPNRNANFGNAIGLIFISSFIGALIPIFILLFFILIVLLIYLYM